MTEEQQHPGKAKAWIEAMRLRTLPVSIAGVLAGCACAMIAGSFRWLPALICFLFALTAQIVSNFANEYYDYANGLDKKGREGFRRGVTEGDISPQAMRRAIYLLLGADCLLGCSLIYWGGLWLIPVGIAIAIFALAYSTGPYPLSHHGLGDIAVVIFFGLVPVYFTAYVQASEANLIPIAIPIGIATGLLAANVLIVNNYRDADADRLVGKHTTVVIFGRQTMWIVYLLDALVAMCLFAYFGAFHFPPWAQAGWQILSTMYVLLWLKIKKSKGTALNLMLKRTAQLMLIACIYLIVLSAIY